MRKQPSRSVVKATTKHLSLPDVPGPRGAVRYPVNTFSLTLSAKRMTSQANKRHNVHVTSHITGQNSIPHIYILDN